MFNNNRHLNIFEHYTQKGSLPIENNISRGLAILFNENNLVLDRFIDLVNAKCIKNNSACIVPKPQKQDDIEVGIQQQVSKIVTSYPNPQNIVGITLTTSSPVNIIENKKDDNNNLIIDIVISCRETLIIIEVKRNATDARLQVMQQVDSVIAEIVNRGQSAPEKEILDGTWEELIGILKDVHNLTGFNDKSILGNYLKHLENNYQVWFPITLLSDLEIKRENEVAIDKRILKLVQNCCENKDDEKRYSGRSIIPLDYEFTNEAQIKMDYDAKRLMVTIYSGDTKSQGYCLLNKTTHDLSWIYNKSLIVESNNLEVLTVPYIRASHFHSSIVVEEFKMDYYEKNFGTIKTKCIELYNDISKRWNRKDWDQLKSLLKTEYVGLIDINRFNDAFKKRFEDCNRNYADVSFGYKTTIYLESEVINKFEKNNDIYKQNDELANFISKIIKELINKIK